MTIPIELMDLTMIGEYDAQPLSFDVSGFGGGDDGTGPDGQTDAGMEDGEGVSSSGCGCDAAGARTGGSLVRLLGVALF